MELFLDKNPHIKMISLGGAGGCGISLYLQKFKNQPRYMYDWVVSSQIFILNSFFDINNYINFKENNLSLKIPYYPYHFNTNLNRIDAIAIHDNLTLVDDNIQKYKERFKRLHCDLENNTNKIYFIRLLTEQNNIGVYNYTKHDGTEVINKFVELPDSIEEWCLFMDKINKINSNVILILFSEYTHSISKINDNVYIVTCYSWDQVLEVLNL